MVKTISSIDIFKLKDKLNNENNTNNDVSYTTSNKLFSLSLKEVDGLTSWTITMTNKRKKPLFDSTKDFVVFYKRRKILAKYQHSFLRIDLEQHINSNLPEKDLSLLKRIYGKFANSFFDPIFQRFVLYSKNQPVVLEKLSPLPNKTSSTPSPEFEESYTPNLVPTFQ